CALERLRAVARTVRSSTTYVGAPGGRALPTNTMVVGLLCLACVRISGQGTDRMDSTANGRIDNVFRSQNATRATIQNCARRFAYSRNRRHLGGSSVDPDTWRVFYERNWTPRRRPLVGHDGRSGRKFRWDGSAVVGLFFRNDFYQLLCMGDQTSLPD